MGVLGHAAALVSVQEDVVDVERGGDKGLVVGGVDSHAGGCGRDRAKVCDPVTPSHRGWRHSTLGHS